MIENHEVLPELIASGIIAFSIWGYMLWQSMATKKPQE